MHIRQGISVLDIHIYIKTVLDMSVRLVCDACGSLPRVGYVGVSVP